MNLVPEPYSYDTAVLYHRSTGVFWRPPVCKPSLRANIPAQSTAEPPALDRETKLKLGLLAR